MAQNISELIGEIKFVQSQNGGYYLLIAGGQKYNLINLPKQQGQVQEGLVGHDGHPHDHRPLMRSREEAHRGHRAGRGYVGQRVKGELSAGPLLDACDGCLAEVGGLYLPG